MSFLSSLFGGRKDRPNRSSPPPEALPPAKGWIRVDRGTPQAVEQAIRNQAGDLRKEQPRDFPVRILEHPEGFLAVTFPGGVIPYDFANLIAWLDNPPDTEGVSGAAGWISSPSTGRRYTLLPDRQGWDDTLVGRSAEGQSVQIYLPEAAMCEISRDVDAPPEPDTAPLEAAEGRDLTVTLDANPSFGNPGLELTHPRDTNWD